MSKRKCTDFTVRSQRKLWDRVTFKYYPTGETITGFVYDKTFYLLINRASIGLAATKESTTRDISEGALTWLKQQGLSDDIAERIVDTMAVMEYNDEHGTNSAFFETSKHNKSLELLLDCCIQYKYAMVVFATGASRMTRVLNLIARFYDSIPFTFVSYAEEFSRSRVDRDIAMSNTALILQNQIVNPEKSLRKKKAQKDALKDKIDAFALEENQLSSFIKIMHQRTSFKDKKWMLATLPWYTLSYSDDLYVESGNLDVKDMNNKLWRLPEENPESIYAYLSYKACMHGAFVAEDGQLLPKATCIDLIEEAIVMHRVNVEKEKTKNKLLKKMHSFEKSIVAREERIKAAKAKYAQLMHDYSFTEEDVCRNAAVMSTRIEEKQVSRAVSRFNAMGLDEDHPVNSLLALAPQSVENSSSVEQTEEVCSLIAIANRQ